MPPALVAGLHYLCELHGKDARSENQDRENEERKICLGILGDLKRIPCRSHGKIHAHEVEIDHLIHLKETSFNTFSKELCILSESLNKSDVVYLADCGTDA